MRPSLALVVLTLAAAAFAGCTAQNTDQDPPTDQVLRPIPVQDRHLQPYHVDEFYSHTFVQGVLAELPVQSVFVEVTLPLTSGGAAVIGGAGPLNAPRIHMGIFLPDVPEGTTVPVIADIGPYYSDGDLPAVSNDTHRLGGFLIKNFVPHGYAVAQVSVFGTGESNHCMDLMGPDEQAGIDAAVTWLGTQDWSNGKVGLIGRSYDGSTPWEAAAMGNEHLATIVPISGLTGMYELMWRNGTAETRGAIMHNVVYGQFGIDSAPGAADPEDVQTFCQGYLTGLPEGAAALGTGGNMDQPGNTYWTDRYFFERAITNWNGSVYFIHGLQDWNVDPHMAFPYYNMVRDAGLEAKGLFGQWAHMYPDRPSEHSSLPSGEGKEAYPESVRYDWAQDLLEWFDHYLKGTGPKPALHTEVQDNQGQWRIEPGAFPSPDAMRISIASDAFAFAGEPMVTPGMTQPLEYTLSEGLANETHISGNVYLGVDTMPMGSGGQLYVELRDLDDDLRLGHAIMDLRYAAGGNEAQPVTAGMPLLAKMEFEVMDVVVPAGHKLVLQFWDTGRDYLPTSTPAPVMVEGFTLHLPVLPEGHGIAFTPPEWSGKAESAAQQP